MSELVFHTELSREAEIVMTVIGDIDAANAHQLIEVCDRDSAQCDVVDLRFVSLFSAAGISALLSMRDAHPLRVVASAAVQRVFEVTGMTDVFEVSVPAGPPHLHRASFGVAVYDADLRFRYVNDALASINGLAAQAHYGCRPDELFEIHLDELSPILRSVLNTGIEHTAYVAGDTAAVSGGLWRCGYRRACFALPPTGRVESVVIATIERAAFESSPTSVPSHRTSLTFHRRSI